MMRRLLRILPAPVYTALQWGAYGLAHFQTTHIQDGPAAGLRFNPYFARYGHIEGTYEAPVQDFLARTLRRGDVFYDVGANVGYFSVLAAHFVGATGRVYAFEPLPLNAACIRRNARVNHMKQIRIFQFAVGEINGRDDLTVTYHPGGATLKDAGKPPDARYIRRVDVASLDAAQHSMSLRPPSLVKIDVEGAEVPVLRGMQRLIEQYRPVILYEIDDQDAAVFDDKQRMCERLLAENGYSVKRLPDSYPDIPVIVGHFAAHPTGK